MHLLSSLKLFLLRRIASRIKAVFTPIIQKELQPIRVHLGMNLMELKKNTLKIKSIEEYAVRVYSQWGEDGILDYLVCKLGLSNLGILELGAGEFKECNSRFLFESRFSRIVTVDSNVMLSQNIQKLSGPERVRILPIEAWITKNNIENIWESANNFLGNIDLISIDLDGNDFWILNQLKDLNSVSIFVVEFNPFFGSERRITSIYRDDFNRFSEHPSADCYGASLSAWVSFFKDRTFTWVGTNEVKTNAFFVRNDLIDKLDCELPKSDSMELKTLTPTIDAWTGGRLHSLEYSERVRRLRGASVFDLSSGSESRF
jgi:hypothetical protein